MGAGLLMRGFASLLTWDPGFDRDDLVLAFALAPRASYDAGQAVAARERWPCRA
jgi:hypothetical protein